MHKRIIKKVDELKTSRRSKKAKFSLWNEPRVWMLLSGILLAYMYFNKNYQLELNIISKNGSSSVDKSLNNQSAVSTGSQSDTSTAPAVNVKALQTKVVPESGFVIPIKWGDLGKQMVESGVIDAGKLRQLFGGKLPDDQEAMLSGNWDAEVKINQQNSRFLLDLLWAFGLGNKNSILTEGEMSDPKYGGAGNFASTGGWSLAKGSTMDHYSKHSFVTLTDAQQKLVEETSKNIYRPCCGNSTHFPDCNHGMAMLGLLELMASQGATEKQMYDTALAVNSLWFPQTYVDLATYFQEQGQSWDQVDAKQVLGQQYSSGQGYAQTRQKIKSLPKVQQGGGGCGV